MIVRPGLRAEPIRQRGGFHGHAAIRPRYGPGAVTALRAGFAVWLFVHATFSLAAGTMGLLPEKIMLISAAWSLPETLVATLAGAWLYREA